MMKEQSKGTEMPKDELDSQLPVEIRRNAVEIPRVKLIIQFHEEFPGHIEHMEP